MTAKGTQEANENPLVPNAKLRQMYTLMLEARTLEEALKKRMPSRGRKRVASIRGQEAVRVSTAIEMGADDLISDTSVSAGMGLILGGEAASLLRGLSGVGSNRAKALVEAGVNRVLGEVEDAEQRLHLATGAALALKAQQRSGVVIAYARKDEVRRRVWREVLHTAQQRGLPMIFIALPLESRRGGDTELAEVCGIAKAAGVPGIPVDLCDAVALYRVTQESLGRARGGDGPVLIECVNWHVDGKRRNVDDPLEHLEEFLRGRKICDDAWFKKTEKSVRKYLLKKRDRS